MNNSRTTACYNGSTVVSFGIIIRGGATDKVTGNLNVKDKRNKRIIVSLKWSEREVGKKQD